MMRYVLLCLACALASGCSTAPTESLGEFRETLYVEGFLRAGNAVDSVLVGTTMPIYDAYDRDASAVTDAQVVIDVDGASHALVPLSGKLGYYHAPTLQVEAGETYRLTVTTSLGTATAETTVPFPPSALALSDVLLVGGDSYQISWTGETQGGYVTTRKPVALGEQIPLSLQFGDKFTARFLGGGFDTTGLGAVRDSIAQADQWRYLQSESTTLNAGQFYYYGTYAFWVYTIDGNYADFLVSSNQDPELLDEPRFHVTGGIGVFASIAADSLVFRVE